MNSKAVIDKRRQLWERDHNIEQDRAFRMSIASFLTSEQGESMRKEVRANPELMIELFFCIVDKEQTTMPFFLNTVQRELIDIINKDIELYNQGKKHHLKYLLLKGRQQGRRRSPALYKRGEPLTMGVAQKCVANGEI